ncbi:MAG: DUF1549 domain-containing protein [Pirellulaceae bacterium]|nr:DUF1549 domain-containing protein [Pirellulaceae bacterium]
MPAAFLLAAAWISPTIADDPTDVQAKNLEYFEKQIRPVLVEKCYECHSAATESSGGLVLDSKPGWQRGGDSGPAIDLKQPDASRLLKAMEYAEPDLKMPPDGRLPADVIQHFKQWIADGAVDPRDVEPVGKAKASGLSVERAQEHWSYRPVTEPKVPALPAMHDARNAIDAFLLSKLAESDIEPTGEVDPRSLLRRLTFDLHGLPPTPEALDAFADDTSPDRAERAVDRLLASPRFGERMARHWMDVARYAESVTLRGLVLSQAWRYRDYLITAFAEDRPFDTFLREQIAGDLLQHTDVNRRSQQIVATGFLALGNTNLEEQDKEQLEMDYIDEQLDVIGRVFMGQTIGCARCHDHKFDPIPTRDYYAMAGILKSAKALQHENVSRWIELPLPVAEADQARFAEMEKQLASIKLSEASLEKKSGRKPVTAGKKSIEARALPGIVIDDTEAEKVGEWKESGSVGPYVGAGYIHDLSQADISKTVTFEPKALPPGSSTVRFSYTHAENRTSQAAVRVFSADGEKMVSVNQRMPPTIDGLWISLGEFRFEKDGQAFVLVSNEQADGHVVADAVQFLPIEDVDAKQSANPVAQTGKDANGKPDGKPDRKAARKAGAKAAKIAGGQASPKDADNGERPVDLALENELKRLKAERVKLEAALAERPLALTIEEKLPAKDLPVHIRGNVHNLGSIAPRGFLQAASFQPVPALTEETSGRREMADWLADVRHPLTARVMVNRLWHWAYGAGLVRTVDNFGTTGETPTHPELLDFLASDFMRHDWSPQYALRQMLNSTAYRRSSLGSEEASELDPENRLWSHSMRKRIPVEAIRDSMLVLSGELVIPGSRSTLRPGLKEDYSYRHVENLRAVYQPILRNSLPELYEAFDFPNPSISIGQRSQSVVSPQALALLNSPWVHSRAVGLQQRLDYELDWLRNENMASSDWQNLINEVFQRCLGRLPSEIEIYTATKLIEELDAGRSPRSEIVTRLIHGVLASVDFQYLD